MIAMVANFIPVRSFSTGGMTMTFPSRIIRRWLPLLLGLLLAGCDITPPTELRIATNIWPGYELFYLARELGYYDICGWFQAHAYLRTNPRHASQRLAQREQVTPDQFLASLNGIHLPDAKENLEFLLNATTGAKNQAHRLAKVMIGSGLLWKPIATDSLVNHDLIRQMYQP
jgi:hypothetical protein